jgi:hypothetical protein
MIISIIVRSKESLDRLQFQNLMIIKRQAKHWHQVLDQLSEGVLLIEPDSGQSYSPSGTKDGGATSTAAQSEY